MSKKEVVLLSETESLERLLYRLPDNHPKRQFLQVELYRASAGSRGEDRLARKLVEFHPEENHRFLSKHLLIVGRMGSSDGRLTADRTRCDYY
ncbi:hypothetical protein [Planococcus soli]|uniref:hypothetical protein n=1 Tax=Planococcus soli TaxID=2666072 RepID=UPI001F1DCD2B|nr:hypothetical protein [Planococcus soli]